MWTMDSATQNSEKIFKAHKYIVFCTIVSSIKYACKYVIKVRDLAIFAID